jgi:hypothetical protein
MRFKLRKHSGARNVDPVAIAARCPRCRRELPLFCEQADLFAAGYPVWLFCAACERLISPERFARTSQR